MSKQDGYASRTAADLERKYNFGRTFAEVFGLVNDARKAADEAQAAFDNLDQEQIFNLLTNNGKAQGIYRDEAGNVYVNASYIQSGTLAEGQLPASVARKSEIPELVGKLGYLDETGVTSIVKGVVTTDYVNALGISVYAAQIKDVLVIGEQLPADLAVKGEIPSNISQLKDDIGLVKESGITTIVGGIVTTDYVNALGISVDAARVTGKLTVGQLPDTVALVGSIPTEISQLKNDLGYVAESGMTTIVGGIVTTDYVNALGISVDAARVNGKLTVGQLPDGVAFAADVPQAISDLRNDLGFVTESGMTTIVGGIVTTDYVNALGISVDAARVTGTLTIGQLPGTVAQKSEIPTTTSQLTNNSGYVAESGVTSIVKGVVTTDYVNALGISVKAAQITDTLTIGQLPSTVAQKSNIPTKTSQLTNDSSFANTSQIPTKVSQLSNDKDFVAETDMTTIVGGIVTTDYVNALGVYASELVSKGYYYYETVSIDDGCIDFYSGSIYDYGINQLCVESNGVLHLYCGDVIRFHMPSGKYWELSGDGLYYYTKAGVYVNHLQFAN